MAGANWGIGIGAFTEGLANGIRTGKMIGEIRDEREIKNLTKEGMEQAKAARANDVDGAITSDGGMEKGAGVLRPEVSGINAEPAPKVDPVGAISDTMDAVRGDKTRAEAAAGPEKAKPMTWNVGGRTFTDYDAARKASESQADSVMDFFMRDAAPKIRDAYMGQGKIEQADKFNSWIEEQGTKAGMKSWSRAVTAAQMGDYDGAARHLVKAYNSPGYFEDGYKAGKAEVIKDDKGNATGFRVVYEGADGKKHTQEYSGTEDMLSVGLGMLSPQARFKAIYDESLSAKKSKLESLNKAAEKAEDRTYTEGANARRDARNHRYRMDEIDRRGEKLVSKPKPNSNNQRALDERVHRTLVENNFEYRKMDPAKQKAYRDQYMKQQGWSVDAGASPVEDVTGDGLGVWMPGD